MIFLYLLLFFLFFFVGAVFGCDNINLTKPITHTQLSYKENNFFMSFSQFFRIFDIIIFLFHFRFCIVIFIILFS